MKITCQSCQSKYTIADEKIHGKIARIRCRKCGETIEIDGTRLGAEESETSTAPESTAENEQVWTVNLADDDQRSMTLSEVVEAYNSGAITAETYLWTDGMADWAPLAEVPEVVAALGSGMPPATDDGAEPVRDSMFHEPPYAQGYEAQSMGAAEEPAAAVARPASGVDLFGGQEPAPDSEETRSPLSTPQPLGARDEQSVLFSLSALTASAPKVSVPPSSTGPTEDSGLIDLNALAAKSQQDAATEAEPTPAPTPFLFPAALGSVEPVTTTTTPEASANQKSSKAPIFIGAGIAVAGVALALVMATRPAETPPAPAPTTTAAAVAPTTETTEKAEPAPAPTTETTPEPAVSAAPAASAEEPAPVAKKPATTKPAAKPATKPASKPASTSQGGTKPASAPASKKSNCGCAPADLQCQIRCSATGR